MFTPLEITRFCRVLICGWVPFLLTTSLREKPPGFLLTPVRARRALLPKALCRTHDVHGELVRFNSFELENV